MKYDHRYDKNKAKNVKRARTMILFIIIASFVVGVSTLMAVKFSESKQAVQALDNTDPKINSEVETGDKQESNTEGNKIQDDSLSSDPNVEAVAFLEKYLNQQMKSQKPDGADGKKVVYLTFDDGPAETVTPKILDILKAENVHATFFIVGKAVDESEVNKNIVKRQIAEGNAIGNHTYSHNYNYLYPQGSINVDNCIADIEKTNQTLRSVLGEDFFTKAIRFPGGHMTWGKRDPKGMDAMDKALQDKGYHQVDWNALSSDAEGAPKNAEQLKQNIIKTVSGREKAVILMHDTYGKEETAKALPDIIKYLKEQGYVFKTIK